MKELTSEEVCLALGYFDSVHLGHRNLINVAREYAHKNGIGCAVATFSNNAYKLFNFDGKQVYTYAERCEILKDLCDYILPMRFDARLKNYNAEQFLNLLTTRHNIKALVCGYDYSFGAGAKGDSRVLKEYCDKRGIDCIIVSKYEADGERISTTIVKDLLVSGKIEEVNTLLGAPFMLRGRVVRGRGAGRMFDIPTANIKFSSGKMLPANGVYGTTCSIEGKVYDCATNIGARPTFGLTKSVVETMIKDFNDNIYDKDITVYFHKRLRGVTKFDTPAELSKQVHKDIEWKQHD